MNIETGKHTISVIMPVYNGSDYIVHSLPPLVKMLKNNEICELIIVDDGSTDDTVSIAEEMGAKVIPSGGRLGPGGARNLAVEIAQGDIVWFVDADVVVHDNAADEIHRGFNQPEVTAVFGSYDDKPAAKNFLSQYKNLVHHFYHNKTKSDASTFWAGCGAIKRDIFLKLGGYDTDKYKRPSIEDIELGYRIISAGGKILLLPQLQSTHLKVWKLLNLLHTEIFCRAIPWSRLLLSETGLIDELNVGATERIKAILAGIFSLSILGSVFFPEYWMSIIVTFGLVFAANYELYKLFSRRKSFQFAIGGLLFHQIYYLYSGAAFVWCWLEHLLLSRKSSLSDN